MLGFATQIAARRGANVPGSARVAGTAITATSLTVLAALVAFNIARPPSKPSASSRCQVR